MPSKEITVDHLPFDIKDGDVYSIAQSNPNSFTHCFFKYPCKFIPEIPKWAITKYQNGPSTVVYDPFSGSGTTLVEASLCNYQSFGSEIDETAKLITRAKTTCLSDNQIKEMDSVVDMIIHKASDNDNNIICVPEMLNIEHWFSIDTIYKLGRIRYQIDRIKDKPIKDFLKVCLASIIKKVSFCDDISPKPYVSSKVTKTPPDAIIEFSSTYCKYRDCIIAFSKRETVKPEILSGGAFGLKETQRFDIAITSPPYINAFDYARSMRLENLWLGFETEDTIRRGKKNYVGTESIKIDRNFSSDDYLKDSKLLATYLDEIKKVDLKRAVIVNKFFVDMKTNLQLTYNALKIGGHYIIVIGNSEIRKIEVKSWEVIKEISESIGFKYDYSFSYIIKNPYIRIPRNGQGGKIANDFVLVLSKN